MQCFLLYLLAWYKNVFGLRRQPHLFRLDDPCLRTTCSGRGRLEQLVDASPEAQPAKPVCLVKAEVSAQD